MRTLMIALSALAFGAGARLHAQQTPPTMPAVPTTKVLAIGHRTQAFNPAEMRSFMPNEVRDTVNLYLEGKLDQWFVRKDGMGVVFLLNASSTEEAQAMLSKLPLVQSHRMEFDLMPLGPLSPLRYLMGEPAGATKP